MTLRDMVRERGRLLSTLDLVELMTGKFDILIIARIVHATSTVDNIYDDVREFRVQDGTVFDSESGVDLVKFCIDSGLPTTSDALLELVKLYDPANPDSYRSDSNSDREWTGRYRRCIGLISFSIKSELSRLTFIHIDPSLQWYWNNPLNHWGHVIAAWPDTNDDIENASRCMALSMPTSAVFHLSRIAERGLRDACAKYIPAADLPQPPQQMMGKYLECIENFAKIKPKPAGAVELTEAATYFRPIKSVWRDNVSHAGVEYNERQAERCYTAIRDMLIACAKLV